MASRVGIAVASSLLWRQLIWELTQLIIIPPNRSSINLLMTRHANSVLQRTNYDVFSAWISFLEKIWKIFLLDDSDIYFIYLVFIFRWQRLRFFVFINGDAMKVNHRNWSGFISGSINERYRGGKVTKLIRKNSFLWLVRVRSPRWTGKWVFFVGVGVLDFCIHSSQWHL